MNANYDKGDLNGFEVKYNKAIEDKYLNKESLDKISIITTNYNGNKFMKNFLESILKNVKYRNFEIIIVDNASSDNSLDLIEFYMKYLNIKVIVNKKNESYSRVNNQGAEKADGKYLIFVNNNIEIFEGWLEELLFEQTNQNNVGLTGSLLLYPPNELNFANNSKADKIQHCGIKFRKIKDGIIPYNFKNGEDSKNALSSTTIIAGVTGASFMVEKKKFEQVQGFCEDYINGYEDVDLSLKMIKKGYLNYIVPNSKAYYYESETQINQNSLEFNQIRLYNRKVLSNRWAKWLESKMMDDLIKCNKIFIDKVIKIAFVVSDVGEHISESDYFVALEFSKVMKLKGWNVEFLRMENDEWYNISEDIDIIISLLDSYDVNKVKSKNKEIITVALVTNLFERWASKVYIKSYDYILASSEKAREYMEKKLNRKVYLFKIATNNDSFSSYKINHRKEFMCDCCFTEIYRSENKKQLAKNLQDIVINYRTYDRSVDELSKILLSKNNKKILIKTAISNQKVANAWGDYHFAKSMIKEFDRQGFDARMQFVNEWNSDDSDVDVVIVLRGLAMYKPKDYHYNIMWNISHPDNISIEEYYSYDTVYIASNYWSKEIKEKKDNNFTTVKMLLQCTDPEVFKPSLVNNFNYELLFVGNSRNVFRKVIRDVIPTKYKLDVYGSNWDKFIDKKYIRGQIILNSELYMHYSSAKVVLNDHWEDMRDKGFISNRIFDVLACKGVLLTDNVIGIEECLGKYVLMYRNKQELEEKIEQCMSGKFDKIMVEDGYEAVIKDHTFEERIKEILTDLGWI